MKTRKPFVKSTSGWPEVVPRFEFGRTGRLRMSRPRSSVQQPQVVPQLGAMTIEDTSLVRQP